MRNLAETDAHFKALGATHYHDSLFPIEGQRRYPELGRICSRHYFNPEGTEIGLVHPYLLQHGTGVQVFETLRAWDLPHILVALPE